MINEKGGLCFYATRGIKPEPLQDDQIQAQISKNKEAILKHGGKILDEPAKTVDFYEFNEGKEWI